MLHCTVHGSVVVCLPCEETVKSYTEFVGFSSFHAFDMRLILCAVLRLGPGFPASLKVPREAGTGMENVRNDPMLKNYLYLLSMILVFGEHIKPHNGTLWASESLCSFTMLYFLTRLYVLVTVYSPVQCGYVLALLRSAIMYTGLWNILVPERARWVLWFQSSKTGSIDWWMKLHCLMFCFSCALILSDVSVIGCKAYFLSFAMEVAHAENSLQPA